MHKFSPGGARAAQRSVAANHTGSGEGGGSRREEVVEKREGERRRRGREEEIRGFSPTFSSRQIERLLVCFPITHRNNSKILFHRSLINRPSARQNFPTSLLWHLAPSPSVLTENFTLKTDHRSVLRAQ